ncbi:hypothetical protein GX48_07140 [Paracoccidioides brasiliensis]|nr:hypothetical protein GX48_07140 [Paracoccidioides brasiliensis]
MATKKDMRRPDLVVPYVEPPEKRQDADMNSTVSSTMPMAAMFTKNKMIAWYALILTRHIDTFGKILSGISRTDYPTPVRLKQGFRYLLSPELDGREPRAEEEGLNAGIYGCDYVFRGCLCRTSIFL